MEEQSFKIALFAFLKNFLKKFQKKCSKTGLFVIKHCTDLRAPCVEKGSGEYDKDLKALKFRAADNTKAKNEIKREEHMEKKFKENFEKNDGIAADKNTKQYENWQVRFSSNLQSIRKAKNASLTEFAQEIGIAKSTIQSVIKDGNTTLNTAISIANAFDMTLDELVNSEIRFNGLKANGLEVRGLTTGSTADCEESVSGEGKVRMAKVIKELLDIYGGVDESSRGKFKYHITELLGLVE